MKLKVGTIGAIALAGTGILGGVFLILANKYDNELENEIMEEATKDCEEIVDLEEVFEELVVKPDNNKINDKKEIDEEFDNIDKGLKLIEDALGIKKRHEEEEEEDIL